MKHFHILNGGSLVGITPVTPAAREWIDENVQAESWQWLGGTLYIDHCFASDLIDGINAEFAE